MEEQKQIPGWVGSCMGAVFALMFLGAGLLIVLTAMDIIHVPEENFKVPRTIVLAAGLVFFLAGVFITMGVLFSLEELRQPVMLWIQYLLALAMMASFSAPFLWAGFGPGEREFSQTTTVGPVHVSQRGDETTGRFVFGGAGLLCGLGTIWYAFSAPGRILRGEFKSMFDQNRRTIVLHRQDE
jgi:Ca2+/Na+ antiporter